MNCWICCPIILLLFNLAFRITEKAFHCAILFFLNFKKYSLSKFCDGSFKYVQGSARECIRGSGDYINFSFVHKNIDINNLSKVSLKELDYVQFSNSLLVVH